MRPFVCELYSVMRRHFACCCVILLLAACVGGGGGGERNPLAFSPPVFPVVKQVTVTPFPGDFLLGNAFAMEDMGDYFIVGTYIDKQFLHVFKKESLTFVKSFGSYGQGPGELNSSPKIRFSEDYSELFLYQCANGRYEYWTYDIENVLHDDRVTPRWQENVVLFRDEGAQYPGYGSNFLAWKDRRLFAGSRMHRFEVQDTLGNTLHLYDGYPEVRPADTEAFKRNYLHSSLALKPDMTKFAVASGIGCVMEIFTVDASGKIGKDAEKRFHPPYVNGEQFRGFGDISVTDELIYVSYSGRVYSEDGGSFPVTIGVFDWSGETICSYVLNWKIYRFFVDTQRNRCYLTGIDESDEVLLGYFDL